MSLSGGVCVCVCVKNIIELVRLAITSIRKVQFQQFKYFSVAGNGLFHMIHLTLINDYTINTHTDKTHKH